MHSLDKLARVTAASEGEGEGGRARVCACLRKSLARSTAAASIPRRIRRSASRSRRARAALSPARPT